MTPDPKPSAAQQETGTSRPGTADRERAVRMMVLGAVLAVLAPLGGFLAGSIVGPSRQLGDYDAMFIAMFIGLLVGGAGAVAVLLGLLRWNHSTRHQPPTA